MELKDNVALIVFNDKSQYWAGDVVANNLFIRGVALHLNNCLLSRGSVFLNEVYDAIGLKRTSVGAVSGWYWEDGSNQILLNVVTQDAHTIVIETITDGVIYDKLDGKH